MLGTFVAALYAHGMQYCFVDESGNPSLRNRKPFVVAMVLLDSLAQVEEMERKIRDFKMQNGIPQDYEFHYSRNASTKKNLFLKFIRQNFASHKEFVITKTNAKDALVEVADMVACYLDKNNKYRIIMDVNPSLYKAVKMALKDAGIVAKMSQTKSTNTALIQVADYLAGAASGGLKLEKLP